jgi:hypothetical protein
MVREGSRKRKRKFYGNQHVDKAKKISVDSGEEPCASSPSVGDLSASARKISQSYSFDAITTSSSDEEPNVSGYRLIDVELLSELFQQMPCKFCGSERSLNLEDDARERKGCASHLRLHCGKCSWVYTFFTSKKVKHFFDVNRRFVYAMRSIGQGEASAKRFCSLMNMPPPPKPTAYSATNAALLKAAKTVALETMANAGKELHHNHDDEVVQCGVSSDGTWQRRGYASLNGCVTTISMETGKCLDVEIMSKVCHTCQKISKEKDEEKKASREADHITKCKANYRGSAPAMETEGVKRIFQRSEATHMLQYTQYFGDGDSKAYNEVQGVYGDKVEVVKKECVGHVQKRVGTALRKLKKENKGLGGKGKLTDSFIDKLQNYYGIAIRSNPGNLEAMKKAVLASMYHCAASKRRNIHNLCPDGPDGWCRFKQDRANNTSKYKPGAGLPDNILKLVKPIYERLSNDELLKKCLDGKTQNQNESLNGMIWKRLPKIVFVGADVLQLGVYDAVAHFNIGSKTSVQILKELGMVPGLYFEEGIKKADKQRVAKANHKNKAEIKKQRKVTRGLKKRKDDKIKEQEGKTYKAGSF